MKFRLCAGLLLLPLACQAQQAESIYTFLESDSYSDAAPLDQTIDGLKGDPVTEGEFAYTHNQFEAGYQRGRWTFSYFARYDQFLQFNDDTARLIYLDKNDIAIESNETFDVELDVNGMLAHGFGISYELEENAIAARYRLNYFYAREMNDGKLWGQVQTLSSGYRGDLTLDYGYSEDLLLERAEESVTGHGLGLDMDLVWTVDDATTVRFSGRDILARIRWADLTYTEAQATTNTISYRPDGTLDSIPGIAGIEGYRTQTQRLPTRLTLAADYKISQQFGAGVEMFRYDNYNFPRVKAAWHGTYLSLEASYDFRSQALGLALDSRYVSLAVRADSTDWQDAQALGLVLQVQVPLN